CQKVSDTMGQQDLVSKVRKAFLKPKGYRVFFASGLNERDVQLMWSQLSDDERALALELYNASFGVKISKGEEADGERLLAMCNALFETSSNVSSLANVYASSEDVIAIVHSSPVQETDVDIKTERDDLTVTLAGDVKDESNVVSRGTYWIKNRKDGIYGEGNRNSYSPLEIIVMISNPCNLLLYSNE
ncbi:unnamed protein product, partial [Allacma fusca]